MIKLLWRAVIELSTLLPYDDTGKRWPSRNEVDSPDMESICSLILDFLATELVKNVYYLILLLWCHVIAIQMNWEILINFHICVFLKQWDKIFINYLYLLIYKLPEVKKTCHSLFLTQCMIHNIHSESESHEVVSDSLQCFLPITL